MRRLIFADVMALARALQAAPDSDRIEVGQLVMMHADVADRFRKRFARRHPLWGDGTLEAAARASGLAPASDLRNPAFRAAFGLALRAIDEDKLCRAARGQRREPFHSPIE
jgi:hypothetical protein